MTKKAPAKRKKTTKWQRFGTNLKISRVLASLVFLAVLKLIVFGLVSVDSLTLKVFETVLPDAVPGIAVAADAKNDPPTPIADKADSEANRTAEAEAEAAPAKMKIRTHTP